MPQLRSDEFTLLVEASLSTNNVGSARYDAVRALVALGTNVQPAVPQLEAALGDPDQQVRHLAANALLWLGTNSVGASGTLASRAGDTNEYGECRQSSIMALGAIGVAATHTAPVLIDVLGTSTEPEYLRVAAQKALVAIGVRSEADRTRLLAIWQAKHQSDSIRIMALELYSSEQTIPPSVIDDLCVTLNDERESTVIGAKTETVLISVAVKCLEKARRKQMALNEARSLTRRILDAFEQSKRPIPSEIDRVNLRINDMSRRQMVNRLLIGGGAIGIAFLMASWCFTRFRSSRLVEAQKSICVIEDSTETFTQGTAFFLKDIGLVTCEHVVKPSCLAFRPAIPEEKGSLRVLAADARLDLAVLDTELSWPDDPLELDLAPVELGQRIIVIGFPQYAPGASSVTMEAQVVGTRQRFGQTVFKIDKAIIAGTSGGPVLNMNGKVVGVAVCGIAERSQLSEVESLFIPIGAIRNIHSK